MKIENNDTCDIHVIIAHVVIIPFIDFKNNFLQFVMFCYLKFSIHIIPNSLCCIFYFINFYLLWKY